MRIWTTDTSDVRDDRTIAVEVAEFLARHKVRDSVTHDRATGCPHEEGNDYPMGRTCPRCPFWTDIDRFTHEPSTPPTPTLSPQEILEALSSDPNEAPSEALESADGDESFEADPATEKLLLEAIAQRDAGDTIAMTQLLSELRRRE